MVKTTNQWYFLGAKTQGSLTSRGRAQEPNHWSCWLIRMYRIVPMERFLDRPSQIGKIRVWNPPTRSQKLLDSFSSSNIMFSPWRTKPCQRHAPCCGKNLLRNRAFSLVRWIYDDLRNTWKPLDTFVFPMCFSISGFSIQWFQYRHLSHILQFPSVFPWAGKSSRNVATNESEQPERFTVHGVTWRNAPFGSYCVLMINIYI